MNSKKHICDYGCGREAKHQFKNGKWCCSKSHRSCPGVREKNSIQTKKTWEDPNSIYNSTSWKKKRSDIMKKARNDLNSKYNSNPYKDKRSNILIKLWKDPNSKFYSATCREKKSSAMKNVWKNSDSGLNSISCKKKKIKALKFSIKKINKKYTFFSKIEEMRYNPNNYSEKEIQVHCKNHNCKNSKEKGGWFTPTYTQLHERIRALENPRGFAENNFYCCQECKDICPLYHLRSDPCRNTSKPYTSGEYNTFNTYILERDNNTCCYCGERTNIVHHLRPQKIEPFFALDPYLYVKDVIIHMGIEMSVVLEI